LAAEAEDAHFVSGFPRVGMESEVGGWEDGPDWPFAISGRTAEPSTAAVAIPPALRKVRRFLLNDMSDLGLLMTPPTAS
jgi:hypothetical protein